MKKFLPRPQLIKSPCDRAFPRVLQMTRAPADIYPHSVKEVLEIKMWIQKASLAHLGDIIEMA